MTSPVERISGPKDRVDTWETGKGQNRLFHSKGWVAIRSMAGLGEVREVRQRLARHDARGDGGDGLQSCFGDKRHGPRRARVHLDQVNLAVFDCELDVHQADHIQRKRQFFGLTRSSAMVSDSE